MNVEKYEQICESLLNKHYGINLNDTQLCDKSLIEGFLHVGMRPYEAVNMVAEKANLDRADMKAGFFRPTKKPITELDEIWAEDRMALEGVVH